MRVSCRVQYDLGREGVIITQGGTERKRGTEELLSVPLILCEQRSGFVKLKSMTEGTFFD